MVCLYYRIFLPGRRCFGITLFFRLCASRYGFYLICDDLIGYIFIMQISISDNGPISLNTSAGGDG